MVVRHSPFRLNVSFTSAAGLGFEPRLQVPETRFLPLEDPALMPILYQE